MAEAETPERRLARCLRQYRKDRQVSQQQIAVRMRERGHDLDQVAVSRIESGERKVRLNEAVELAKIVGVSLVTLTGRRHDRRADLVESLRRERDEANRLRLIAEAELTLLRRSVRDAARDLVKAAADG